MKISGSIPAKNRIKGNTSPVFKEGMVPSIIYGGKIEPKMVSVHNITLKKDSKKASSTQKFLN
jgi:ribosomal protein L25 (general stress protein Ctc)